MFTVSPMHCILRSLWLILLFRLQQTEPSSNLGVGSGLYPSMSKDPCRSYISANLLAFLVVERSFSRLGMLDGLYTRGDCIPFLEAIRETVETPRNLDVRDGLYFKIDCGDRLVQLNSNEHQRNLGLRGGEVCVMGGGECIMPLTTIGEKPGNDARRKGGGCLTFNKGESIVLTMSDAWEVSNNLGLRGGLLHVNMDGGESSVPLNPGAIRDIMEMTAERIGVVIGRAGATIKELEKLSSCQVRGLGTRDGHIDDKERMTDSELRAYCSDDMNSSPQSG